MMKGFHRASNPAKRAVAAVLLMAGIMLWGCGYENNALNQHLSNTGDDARQVSPVADQSSSRDNMDVTLYYRYADEPMLASQTRAMDFPVDERVEKYIIDNLIEGPGDEQTVLMPLFNEGVTVKVEDSGRILMVTLSKEFMDPPKDAPEEWEDHPVWSGQVRLRRKLGLYSIINTITEIGRYEKVQLFVDTGAEGLEAGRIYSHEVGLADSADRTLLSALSRDTTLILTPSNVTDIVLSSLGKRDWDRLYKYVAEYDIDKTARPTKEDMQTSLLSQAPAVTQDYSVGDITVSADGQQATVCVNYTLLYSDDRTVQKTNMPLKLIRENEIWMIVYSSLNSLIRAE